MRSGRGARVWGEDVGTDRNGDFGLLAGVRKDSGRGREFYLVGAKFG